MSLTFAPPDLGGPALRPRLRDPEGGLVSFFPPAESFGLVVSRVVRRRRARVPKSFPKPRGEEVLFGARHESFPQT